MSITRTARRSALTALVALGVAGSGSVASAQAAGSCGWAADAVPTNETVRYVEDAMICLANEYRVSQNPWISINGQWYNAGQRNPLAYDRNLQLTAEEDARSIVSTSALPQRSAQDRASDRGYKMGARCRTNDFTQWVKAGSDWENDGYGRNTARFAVNEIMKDIGSYVRDTTKYVNIGAGVVAAGAGGVRGATFAILVGQCTQG